MESWGVSMATPFPPKPAVSESEVVCHESADVDTHHMTCSCDLGPAHRWARARSAVPDSARTAADPAREPIRTFHGSHGPAPPQPSKTSGRCVCVCVWSQRSVFTYRKSHLTQLVHPVVQLLQVCSEQVDLLRGLDEEGSRVSGTSVQLHLGHADAVGQPDHLEAARR